jgi:hypothetical protein
MRWRSRAMGLAGLVLASMTMLAWPLRAAPIDPPLPPVPPPPAEVQPVLELLAPVVSPECGNTAFAVALLPTVTGMVPLPGGLPVNILPVFGPVLVVCGAVPQPGVRLSCSADESAAAALNQVTTTAAGLPLPADSRVIGPVVQEVFVLQDNLPAPANSAGLAEQISGALQCHDLAAVAPAPVDTSPPAEETQPPADVSGFTVDDGSLGGLSGSLGDFAAAAGPTSPVAEIIAESQRPTVPLAQVSGPGFAYPVILVLPLLLLALGGYLGWALTRPVVPTQR